MNSTDRRDEFRWPALFRRSREPIFVLNRRRQLIFANTAWEALTGVTATDARGLVCTRRATGHSLADLGRTLVPPSETIKGVTTRARRPFPGTAAGPPWWDIDFLPLMGGEGVIAMVGRIRRPEPAPVAPRATMPAAWAELRGRALTRHSFDAWESEHAELRRTVAQARLAAQSGCRAIIVGDTGTGKETLARTIHANSSRRELSCVTLDCARLPSEVVRTVVFGPLGLKQSDWLGALYLHEPAALPLDLQAEIATVLADRPQVIAGCSEDPQLVMKQGRLHPELYAALAMLVIHLPSLHERQSEIVKYCDVILRRIADSLGGEPRTITPEAMSVLRDYLWPRNLDELAGVLFAASLRPATTSIDVADLPLALRQGGTAGPSTSTNPMPPLDELLERVERRTIAIALERSKGNKSKAAELLGIWRTRLLRRMEALGIVDKGDEA